MLKSYGVGGVVAHVILVSAQVLLVLTLGLWTLDFGLGLDNYTSEYLTLCSDSSWVLYSDYISFVLVLNKSHPGKILNL